MGANRQYANQCQIDEGTMCRTASPIPVPTGCEIPPPKEHFVNPAEIARLARKYVGSKRWLDKVGANQCNIFVFDVLNEEAAPPPMIGGNLGSLRNWLGVGKNPPTAGEWADPSTDILGWKVVDCGPARALPGDIVAEQIDYRDASGHVGIVVGLCQTASADSTASPPGTITISDYGFRRDSDKHAHGKASKCIFRRRVNYCRSLGATGQW